MDVSFAVWPSVASVLSQTFPLFPLPFWTYSFITNFYLTDILSVCGSSNLVLLIKKNGANLYLTDMAQQSTELDFGDAQF